MIDVIWMVNIEPTLLKHLPAVTMNPAEFRGWSIDMNAILLAFGDLFTCFLAITLLCVLA